MIRTNLPVLDKGAHAFFMAGSPGAGKTEFVRISFEEEINIIETAWSFIGYSDRVEIEFVELEHGEIVRNISSIDFALRTSSLKEFCLAQ